MPATRTLLPSRVQFHLSIDRSSSQSPVPRSLPKFHISVFHYRPLLPYYHRSKMDYNNFHMTRCRPSREGTGILMLIRNLILPFPFCLRIIHTNTTLVTLKIQIPKAQTSSCLLIKLKVIPYYNSATREQEWQSNDRRGLPNFHCRQKCFSIKDGQPCSTIFDSVRSISLQSRLHYCLGYLRFEYARPTN